MVLCHIYYISVAPGVTVVGGGDLVKRGIKKLKFMGGGLKDIFPK